MADKKTCVIFIRVTEDDHRRIQQLALRHGEEYPAVHARNLILRQADKEGIR